ncbi:MAG: FAD:protein FMN transferase [Planctomycetes bacterium]|nr:FAD:protein FMN transferase [Planctomycetota bacterium]
MVEKFAKDHAADTRVIYVVSGSDASRVKEVADERKIAIPIYADPDGQFSEHFNVEMTPTLLDFDRDGKLTGTYDSVEMLPGSSESALPRKLDAVVDSGTEIGTSYDVVVMAADESKAREDLAAAREVVHEAEKHLSEWKADSDISKLNERAGIEPVEVHGDLLKLIKASAEVSKATGGAFDITWLPLGKLWKDAAGADKLPSQEEIDAVLKAVDYKHVVVDGDKVSFDNPDTRIGLGAVAKGWIVDAVFLALKKRGYENLIVNIGGDLRTAGEGPDGPWTFEITDPYAPSMQIGKFDLQDGSVATSGNYLRYLEIEGKRYGHIVDPRTGRPATFDGSVSVFTRDCAMADALATALFVMGPEEGLKWVRQHDGVDAIYATRDGLQSSLPLDG